MIGTRSLGLGLQQARSQSRAATAESRLCSEYLGVAVQLKPSAGIRTLEVQSSTVLTSHWHVTTQAAGPGRAGCATGPGQPPARLTRTVLVDPGRGGSCYTYHGQPAVPGPGIRRRDTESVQPQARPGPGLAGFRVSLRVSPGCRMMTGPLLFQG